MTQLFKPKVNVPNDAPAVPTINEAADRQDFSDRARKRRGRSSTILVPNQAGGTQPASTVLGG